MRTYNKEVKIMWVNVPVSKLRKLNIKPKENELSKTTGNAVSGPRR